MGQKCHPYGLRLGIIRQPRATWFAEGRRYRDQLLEDLKIRRYLKETLANAGLSSVTIDRRSDTITVTLATAKPGIVIGRGGRDVEILRQKLEKMCGQKVRVNVEEVKDPDLDAALIADSIARQIERRVSYRRAMRQAVKRAMDKGAKGVRCKVSGRLQGAEIARTESVGPEGRVPLHTLRADIDYGVAEARTGYGHIGVKVWVYRGDILPPKKIKPEDLYVPEEEAAQEPTAAPATPEVQVAGTETGATPQPQVAAAASPASAEAQSDQLEEAWLESSETAEPELTGDPQDAFIVVDTDDEGEDE